MSKEKEETRDDLVGPTSYGDGGSEWEETPSGTWTLPLPGYWVLKRGEEKEQRSWILGEEGFPISYGKGFLDKGGLE
jgi:hypothetical protein